MTTWKEIAQNLIEEDKKEKELIHQQRKEEEEQTAYEKFLKNSDELKRRLMKLNVFADIKIETIQHTGSGDAKAILKAPPDLEFSARLDPAWEGTVKLAPSEDLPKFGMWTPYRVSSEIEFARFLLDLDSLRKRVVSQREIYKQVMQEIRGEVSAQIGEDCYSRCSVCLDALQGIDIQDYRISAIPEPGRGVNDDAYRKACSEGKREIISNCLFKFLDEKFQSWANDLINSLIPRKPFKVIEISLLPKETRDTSKGQPELEKFYSAKYPHECPDKSFELVVFRGDSEEIIRVWNALIIARTVSFKADGLEDLPWELTIWKQMRKEDRGFEFLRSYRRLIKPILRRLGARKEPILASALREIEKWEI